MRRFNTHNPGFSLIEAVVALLVAAIAFVGIFTLQNTVTGGDILLSNQLNHVLALKNIFNDPAFNERDFKKTTEQEVKHPLMRVSVQAGKVSGHEFAKLKGLMRIEITGSWQDFGWPTDETLVTMRRLPKHTKEAA